MFSAALAALNNKDITQPNEGYFLHVDWIVSRAADYGITIRMLPTWERYVN